MGESTRRPDVMGWAAMATTVALWVVFALTTRAIAFSHLTRLDVALIRYGVPLVVLAPWARRAVREARLAPAWSLLAIVVGGGLPFYLLSARGAALSSATYLGVINPGMPPVFVAIIAALVWRQRFSPQAIAGYGVILAGVVILVESAPAHIGGGAAGFLLLAALCWAWFTIGLQRAALHAVSAALVLCAPSAIVASALILTGVGSSALTVAPWGEIAMFAVLQGVGSGIVSSLAYTLAIGRLGSERAATVGASSPVLVALVAVPVFGETVTLPGSIGIALVVTGILLANRRRAPLPTPASTPALAVAQDA
ncbi:MAG: DMT family transporter [Thermomicrobiales bacterium]